MISIKRIATLFFFVCLFSISIFAQQNNFFLHTITKGQSLYSISVMYGVSQESIINLNPGCEKVIVEGKKLRIPQKKKSSNKDVFHTIKSGETLYRLSIKYKVSAERICKANPGLSATNFKTGQVIRIPKQMTESTSYLTSQSSAINNTIPEAVKPRCKEMHKVRRRETIFSVSRKYGITEQELIDANPELKRGMKKGQYLCIPFPKPKKVIKVEKETPIIEDIKQIPNAEIFEAAKEPKKIYKKIKAAVLLPFLLDQKARSKESIRMTEYYEGILMALDSLKRQGISVDLNTYDTGNQYMAIEPILAKPELKEMDIIFGPLYKTHIPTLTLFAKENNIRLVIPFSSHSGAVFNNPNIFQINTPQSYLYSEVCDHFIRQFRNSHVIFIESGIKENLKTEFTSTLKTQLDLAKVTYETVKSDFDEESLKLMMDNITKDCVFIPLSGSKLALNKVMPYIAMLAREYPEKSIHAFGYPEWQTYTTDLINTFFEVDTYFYSSFYTNNLLPSAVNFINKYENWYKKEITHSFPQYSMLGFDTSYFFIKGLWDYGSEFETMNAKMDIGSIQTGFKFERVNNWGGFINRKVFFVHYSKDYQLIKMDFDK